MTEHISIRDHVRQITVISLFEIFEMLNLNLNLETYSQIITLYGGMGDMSFTSTSDPRNYHPVIVLPILIKVLVVQHTQFPYSRASLNINKKPSKNTKEYFATSLCMLVSALSLSGQVSSSVHQPIGMIYFVLTMSSNCKIVAKKSDALQTLSNGAGPKTNESASYHRTTKLTPGMVSPPPPAKKNT